MPVTLKPYALLTLEQAKAYLKIPVGNEHDDPITTMINGITQRLESAARRLFVSRDESPTNFYDARGKSKLFLTNYPVEVTQVQVRDAVGETFLTVETTDYEVDSTQGILYRVNGTWPDGPMTMAVDESAGYGDLDDPSFPSDLIQIASDYLKFCYDRWSANLIATANQSVSGSSASVVPEPPKDILTALTPYIKRRF